MSNYRSIYEVYNIIGTRLLDPRDREIRTVHGILVYLNKEGARTVRLYFEGKRGYVNYELDYLLD